MPEAATAPWWRRRTLPGGGRPVPRLLWRASRRLTTATVVALFPVLFILDGRLDPPVSPVLPGLGLLALLIAFLPVALAEALARRSRRRPPEARLSGAARLDQWAGLARTVAVLWFLGWLALGA